MATQTQISTITNRLHSKISSKESIFKLLSDSYAGGQSYIDGDDLHKFSARESTVGYDERKKRAVHLNNVQPLADMMSAFLLTEPPMREGIPQDKVIEDIGSGESLDHFMLNIATSSLLYTTGILVDSPNFENDQIMSEADRLNLGLFPYCIKYDPWQILDYYPETGELEWILLDNSYVDKSNPLEDDIEVISYRLWTREFYQDFIKEATSADAEFVEQEPIFYDLGVIPFVFSSWRNTDNSRISDTIFEDVALFDRAIYNSMSLMDEMIATGTFKFLFFPSKNNKLPKELESGFTANAVLPYDATTTGKPFFDGARLDDIDPFLKIMDFYVHSIKRELGLDTDIEKTFVQSGRAKELDFKKVKSLLLSGARSMEDVEKKIFYFIALWEGKTIDEKFSVKYFDDFLGEEVSEQLVRYFQALSLPYEKLKTTLTKLIAEKTISGEVSSKEMKEILDEIEKGEPEIKPLETKELIQEEKINNKE